MASEVRIGKLRYDIVSDTTKFEKGIKATRAEIKMADKAFRDHAKASDITRQKLERLASVERKAGASGAAIAHQRKMLQAQLQQELALEAQLEAAKKKAIATGNRKAAVVLAESESVKKLNKQLLALEKTEEKRALFNARGGAIGGTLGGNIMSMFGLGGVGGAAGRFAGTGVGGFLAPGVASTLGMTGGLFTAGIGIKAIASWGKLEREIVDLSAIIGDESKSKSLVSSLRKLAKDTPLTTSTLIRGVKILKAYGVETKDTTDLMRRFGDATGGSAEKMGALITAYSQAMALGKLQGQERNQLVNAGFAVSEIAVTMGISMDEFKKKMEAGQVPAQALHDTLVRLTNAGGLYAGRMEKASKTVSGSWERMFAEIDEGFANLGEAISEGGVLAKSMRSFGELSNWVLTTTAEGLRELKKAGSEFEKKTGLSSFDTSKPLESVMLGPMRGRIEKIFKDYSLLFKPLPGEAEAPEASGAADAAMGLADEIKPYDPPAPAKPTAEELGKMQAEADANRASAAAMKDQIEFQIRLLKYNDRQKHQATVVRELNQLRKEGKITEMEYNEIYRKRMELYDAQQAMNDQEKQQDEEKSKRIEAIKEQERQQVEALRKRAEAERKALGNTRVTLGGVGGSSAGADYQFLSNRAKSQEQFRLDEERNKKLAEISDRLKGDIDKAGKEADAKIEIIKMGD